MTSIRPSVSDEWILIEVARLMRGRENEELAWCLPLLEYLNDYLVYEWLLHDFDLILATDIVYLM